MRNFWLTFLVSAVALAQQPAGAPAPGQVHITPPDTVVARIDGKEYTAGDVQKLLDEFPPQIRAAFAKQPKETLTGILLVKYLAAQAELHHLDSKEEFKQSQEWNRLQALSQAEYSYYHDSFRPASVDERAYYDKNPEKWDQAKFQEIVIQFAFNPHSQIKRTEAEAKTLADDLRKQIENGANFGEIAKEHSDDKVSALKNGERPVIGRSSPYPEAVKKLLFEMKPSEVSPPVKEPAAYYIVKLNEITRRSFNDVESQIFRELQQEHFGDYVKSVDEANRLIVLDTKFFANSDKN